MEYTTRLGSGPRRAHVNYQCPCGCTGGVIYNAEKPLSKAGACCCGRKLWVGEDAESMLRPYLLDGVEYIWDVATVTLPWGEVAPAAMAWPKDGVPASEAHDHEHDYHEGHAHDEDAIELTAPALVLDVVCRMRIYPRDAVATSEYHGETFYFCAKSCKQRFDANPAAFTAAGAPN
ncbi:MAG: YHS domain-containing protein [Dehalococcoidia bacterium]